LEAVTAIHRLIAAGVERDFRYTAALAARSGEHFTRASAAAFTAATALVARAHGLARLAAIRTTIRLVLEAFLLVKALFARTENKLPTAVDTVEHFICVHETRTP
jgi:hypothetical protein